MLMRLWCRRVQPDQRPELLEPPAVRCGWRTAAAAGQLACDLLRGQLLGGVNAPQRCAVLVPQMRREPGDPVLEIRHLLGLGRQGEAGENRRTQIGRQVGATRRYLARQLVAPKQLIGIARPDRELGQQGTESLLEIAGLHAAALAQSPDLGRDLTYQVRSLAPRRACHLSGISSFA